MGQQADLANNLLKINGFSDGERYYLPLQYGDLLSLLSHGPVRKAGLKPPATCQDFLAAAEKLTVPAAQNNGVDQYGFGIARQGQLRQPGDSSSCRRPSSRPAG